MKLVVEQFWGEIKVMPVLLVSVEMKGQMKVGELHDR